MSKYDQEDLLESIHDIMVAGLNTKIAAIEAEKLAAGKELDPVLKPIPTNGYYEQTWTAKILQTNPAIFYGVEEVTTNDSGTRGAVAKTYKIFCEVVLTDSGMTNDIHKRIARYSRALEELFSEVYAPAISGSLVKVEQVRPFSFKLELDSDEEIKVGGVSLTITLV